MRMQSTDFHRSIEYNVLLDEFSNAMETRKAVQQLSSGKAPGADAIPAEFYKARVCGGGEGRGGGGGYPWQRN